MTSLGPTFISFSFLVPTRGAASLSRPSLFAEGVRGVVYAASSAVPLLQRRVCGSGKTLAQHQGQPAIPGQRRRADSPTGTEPQLSAAAAGTRSGSGRAGSLRGSAPSQSEPRFFATTVRSAGLLRRFRGAARLFVPAFLQPGLPLGFTTRARSGGTVLAATATLAPGTRDPPASPSRHVLTMSLPIGVALRRV